MEKHKILEELGGLDEATYDELVRECLVQTLSEIQQLKKALGKNDLEAVAKIAHGIRGSAGNLRLAQVQEAAKGVESSAKENKVPEAIAASLSRLEEVLKRD